MDLLMALVSILAIIAIVAVGGGLIAFLIHMVVGVFDKDRTSNTTNNELLDYTQYQQLENIQETSHEYDFEAINEAKVEEEKKLAESTEKVEEDVFKLLDEEDDINPEEMEKKLVAEKETPVETIVTETITTTTTTETVPEEVEEEDDFELDNLLDEISNETEDEVKAEQSEETQVGEEIESYSIEEFLSQTEESEEAVEETEEVVEETVEETPAEEIVEETVAEEPAEEIIEETTIETVEEVTEPVVDTASLEEIQRLKAEVAELNKKLSETTTTTTTTTTNVVYTIDMTEEECLNRLAILEERLRIAKKDNRINDKEYRPLKKMMKELEKNQAKLRSREAKVAKQKIALYGVNNYVDIDKEKAEQLANELELLDGLRLSVQHCEEVIAANKDRYPILEHTNTILEEQIANLESDIETTKIILEKIREREGKGGNN